MDDPARYGIATAMGLAAVLPVLAFLAAGADAGAYAAYEPYVAGFLASGATAALVWAIAAYRDRRTRTYVRRANAEDYNKCVLTVRRVLTSPGHIYSQRDIDEMLERTGKLLQRVVSRSLSYSGLLDREEVQSFMHQEEYIAQLFLKEISVSDSRLVAEYYNFLRIILAGYLSKYHISGLVLPEHPASG